MEKWESVVNLKQGLNGEQINDELSDVSSYIGIIEIDKLDKIIAFELPLCFILFYQNHWIAFYITKTAIEIMDSTLTMWENPPKEFINFLCFHQNKIIRSNPILQNDKTNLCALYCIHFVRERYNSLLYKDILSEFTDSTICNDILIKNAVKIL